MLNQPTQCHGADSALELAPRSVVSPATLRPAPRHSWTLAETPRGGGWCGAGHAAVADRVASVTTGGGHVSAQGHVFPCFNESIFKLRTPTAGGAQERD